MLHFINFLILLYTMIYVQKRPTLAQNCLKSVRRKTNYQSSKVRPGGTPSFPVLSRQLPVNFPSFPVFFIYYSVSHHSQQLPSFPRQLSILFPHFPSTSFSSSPIISRYLPSNSRPFLLILMFSGFLSYPIIPVISSKFSSTHLISRHFPCDGK